MNANFAYIKSNFFFLILVITFLLVRGITAGTVYTSSRHTHSTDKVDVAANSSQTTYFYLDPPEVKDILAPSEFSVTINVTAAPETYTWELNLSWDETLLELIKVEEGDFLHRWQWSDWEGKYVPKYETTFLYFPTSLAEANVKGEIRVGCSLKYDVPWASGNGWLCTLAFRVKAVGSCVLNLVDTRLWDYTLAGSPAYTYHPNQDAFFYNTLFHDIGVTNVTAQPTIVDFSGLTTINVTIRNEGNYTETNETFSVTAYADKTPYEYIYDPVGRPIKTNVVVGDEITVGTKTVMTLASGNTTALTFSWNTTGIEEGDYTLSAEAILLDSDTRDNLFIDGNVTINPPALKHDIAITSVVPSKNEVNIRESMTINVTVKNEGNYSEVFDVTVYADLNTTVVGDEVTIGMQTDIDLTNGTVTTPPLTFTWDTTGVSEGTYTISAEVPPVPGERQVDKADNTHVDGTVVVRGAPATNILVYAAAGIVAIVVATIVIYFIKFRK